MKRFFVLFVVACFVTPLFAQHQHQKTPGITHRQVRQHERIKQGVKSGELTKEEAKELRQGQQEVRQMKKEAKSDGTVTKEERKTIMQKQNQESRKIYRMKHNEQKRVQ